MVVCRYQVSSEFRRTTPLKTDDRAQAIEYLFTSEWPATVGLKEAGKGGLV